jgi:monomeric sarcosine oxidase
VEPITITLVPHTHWDREWYEPFAVFSDRLVAMMDTLIELADAGFPHFHLDGQTAMIDDYLARRPEREPDLRRLFASGRLSAGPWVTQMDEFLTSGESHLRNLEMGLTRARDLAGDRALDVGYMPDQFGHVGQMPQILRLAGLERAMVWRGVPASIDRTAFVWEAPDGSGVTTEYMVFGYFNGQAFLRAEGPAELAASIERSVEQLRPFLASDRMVVMVGYDHAGPDARLPGRVEAAGSLLPGIDATIGGIAAHLGAQRPSTLPRWRGELRSSARAHLLPNVYSTRVHQKRERGRIEALIERYAEPLGAQTPGFGWPGEELDRAWTLLLWNGAHDSACGCSHDRVARDVDGRAAEVRSIGEDIVERALTSLGSRIERGGVIRFNPSPFEREGVPGNGWSVVEAGHDPSSAEIALEATADAAGFEAGGASIRLFDEPDVGDLYNFCYQEEGQRPSPPEAVSIRGHEVELSWDGLRVLLRAVRRADEPFLRLEGVIHNERPDHRLRLWVELPTPVRGSTAGSPFELVERPVVGEGGPGEAASATWPARGVVMAADTAVFHEGVMEYEVVNGRALALTLLRCVGRISAQSLATRPFNAGPGTPTPEAQMLGETSFAFGLWRGADRAGLLPNWERFALPLAEAPASGGGTLPSSGSFVPIEGEAQLSNIRRREGHLEVRLWNARLDDPVEATVGGRSVVLGPAEILTVAADRGPTATAGLSSGAMSERFDVVVVGGGAMGTAAARQLAMRGRRVLVIERFACGHDRGSSGGPTRIFRHVYDVPAYVRMTRLARDAWDELQDAAGVELLRVTGGIDIDRDPVAARVLAREGIPFELMSGAAANERWPSLKLPADAEVLAQDDGGVLRAADTVAAQARLAVEMGASLLEHTTVTGVEPEGSGVRVRTDRAGGFDADVAVVSAGAWTAPLLATAGLSIHLSPSLEQVTYFALTVAEPLPTLIDWRREAPTPPYLVPDPWEPGAFKVGLHRSGAEVDPDADRGEPDADRLARVQAYVERRIAPSEPTGAVDTCLYTNARDEDFVLAREGALVVASPCSGHGFKFVPLMGSAIADLATGVDPPFPLEPFRLDRPALRP